MSSIGDLVFYSNIFKKEAANIEYPTNHKVGLVVPGGSNCGNCKFSNSKEDGPHCSNEYWINASKELGGGGGNSKLPVDDPSNFCSDFWEGK